jgi:hypothetical protein
MFHRSNETQVQRHSQMYELGCLLLGGQREIFNHGNVLLALEPPFQALRGNALGVLLRPHGQARPFVPQLAPDRAVSAEQQQEQAELCREWG